MFDICKCKYIHVPPKIFAKAKAFGQQPKITAYYTLFNSVPQRTFRKSKVECALLAQLTQYAIPIHVQLMCR